MIMIMNTNKISFDKAVVNLLNGDTYLFNCKFDDTSTVFTMDDDTLTINLAFSKKDENGEYKILGNKEVSISGVEGTPIFDFDDVERIIDVYDDGVNEFFNYDTDNAYLEDLDCEEVYQFKMIIRYE